MTLMFEVNEAFASWFSLGKPSVPICEGESNGGAIALGLSVGQGTLVTKAVHELQRTNGRYGLISMCCGGGSTGTDRTRRLRSTGARI